MSEDLGLPTSGTPTKVGLHVCDNAGRADDRVNSRRKLTDFVRIKPVAPGLRARIEIFHSDVLILPELRVTQRFCAIFP